VFINKLRIQNYRCFQDKTFLFEKSFVLIEGGNGSGKTTILEALHYGCFLKSFRTNQSKELVSFDQKHFFIQVHFDEKQGDHNQVQIGATFENGQKKQLVKFNKKTIKSYRDLIAHYRIVSLAEDDMQLVQGAPEHRRYFLNQMLVLFEPDQLATLRQYRQVLEHRNQMLIQSQRGKHLEIWTKQLWELSLSIQNKRVAYLQELEEKINMLLRNHFPSLNLEIAFCYRPKEIKPPSNTTETFDLFWQVYKEKKLDDELRWRRSLFGAHLDDFSIIFQEKKARHFASRGQQKLVLFLIKIALAQQLEAKGMQICLLLDDFLTDFDNGRLADCLSLLTKLPCQVFVTCPLKSIILKHLPETPTRSNKTSKIQVIKLP